jgi:protein-disulfide isomerase
MALETARPQLVAYVRLQQEKKLLADLAERLRKRLVVVMGVDINSPSLSPNATLATVAGRVLSAGPVLERLKQIVFELRIHAYEETKRAIDQTIYNLLVVEEARRRNIGPEVIIRTEITDKFRSPTEDEVAKFYAENKDRIEGDLASNRTMIANYLEQSQQTSLERALSEKLRSRSTISVMLKEPEAPVVSVSADDDPSRGDPNAPVSLIVFTDFQCPSCAYNHPLIDEVVDAYGKNVRLVVRDFPLAMHENARLAAEAANAAFAQGKFFEYIQLLFKNQKALDVASLKKYAGEVGLNRVKFDAALDRRTYAAEVDKDIDDGRLYGVLGTPTVFVNGVKVRNLTAETLREAIDRALAQKKQSASSVATPK